MAPADNYPGAWDLGTGDYLLAQLDGDLSHLTSSYIRALDELNEVCLAARHTAFAELIAEDQDQVLHDLEGTSESLWTAPMRAKQFIEMVAHHTAEGIYADPANGGNRGGAAWKMIGFTGETELPPPPDEPALVITAPDEIHRGTSGADYDVIIVGAGAGGGVAAAVIAESGKRVLLLERGPALRFSEVGRDHLRNQRFSPYGHNAGPDIHGNPRIYVDPSGRPHQVAPHQGGYNNNAACVGSGTRVYGAQAWRYMPTDFQMATTYGVPEGSSLADWPVTYTEMAPYYERAEWELGVSGDSSGNRFQGARGRPYPMPAVPMTTAGSVLEKGASSLNWNTFAPPMLINTVPYGGRAACAKCQLCVGFACPTDAKNGTQNTMIPRALATGNCHLVTNAMAAEIDTDSAGKVTGVTYFIASGGNFERRSSTSKLVVVSAGAIETARLLLMSQSTHHPTGLGNRHDQVGRNLQGHYYPGAHALVEDPVYDGIGPGVSIATCQFNHANQGVIGGGMLANEFIKLPIIHWMNALPPNVPKWGAENRQWMRRSYTRTLHVMGPVQDIPNPECRVTLEQSVRDRYGIPVAKLSGATHPETVKTARYMWERAVEWLNASGAVRVWGSPPGLGISGGQHQAGTCRMGDDPRSSVTDRWGRVHDHDNLYVMDASLHVTNGGFNPVLTILAMAFRCSDHLARA